jgi:hypothetical protein
MHLLFGTEKRVFLVVSQYCFDGDARDVSKIGKATNPPLCLVGAFDRSCSAYEFLSSSSFMDNGLVIVVLRYGFVDIIDERACSSHL